MTGTTTEGRASSRSVTVHGPMGPRYSEVLTPEALAFLAALDDAVAGRREEALRARRERRARLGAGTERLDFTDEVTGKRYAVGERIPVVHVRPRGWHLPEKHLWHDVLSLAEDLLDLPRGTVRTTVLIETLPAAFEMEEILPALGPRASALTAGGGDYLFSAIRTSSAAEAQHVLPDRAGAPRTRQHLPRGLRRGPGLRPGPAGPSAGGRPGHRGRPARHHLRARRADLVDAEVTRLRASGEAGEHLADAASRESRAALRPPAQPTEPVLAGSTAAAQPTAGRRGHSTAWRRFRGITIPSAGRMGWHHGTDLEVLDGR